MGAAANQLCRREFLEWTIHMSASVSPPHTTSPACPRVVHLTPIPNITILAIAPPSRNLFPPRSLPRPAGRPSKILEGCGATSLL